MRPETETDIEKLNSFLRGELSAVETYGQCIDKLDEPHFKHQLALLRDSHRQRAERLALRIRTLGGEPEDSSGVWGAFAKLVEGGAALFGDSAAVSTLEEGEDHGKKLYRDNLDELTPTTRAFIESEIMPEQQRTHDVLSRLQERI